MPLDVRKCNAVVDCIMPLLIENDLGMTPSIDWSQIPFNVIQQLQSTATESFVHIMKAFAAKHAVLLSSMKPKHDYVNVYITVHMPMTGASAALQMQTMYSKHIAAFGSMYIIRIVHR